MPDWLKKLLGFLPSKTITYTKDDTSRVSPAEVTRLQEQVRGRTIPRKPIVQAVQAQAPQESTFFEGGTSQMTGALKPGTPENLKDIIRAATAINRYTDTPTQYISPKLLSTLLSTESSFQSQPGPPIERLGGVQAQGMAQFLPSTVRMLQRQRKLPQGFDPNDPAQAIPAAAMYLDSVIRSQGGDVLQGIARYKGGLEAGRPYAEDVLRLMGVLEQYQPGRGI